MTSTAVVPADTAAQDLGLFDAGQEMLTVAAKVATAFADIVKQQHMSKRIGQSDHIYNSAWQTIGAMTGVFILDRGATVTELPWPAIADPDGDWPADIKRRLTLLRQAHALGLAFGYKASFAVHRNGLVMGWAEASCDRNEDQWLAPGKGEFKPDFQLRSNAQTRAQSRALGMPLRWTVKLAGYEPTAVEELDGNEPAAEAAPGLPWGPVTSDDKDLEQAAQIVRILAGDGITIDAEQFVLLMGQAFDGIPVACMKMLRGLARYISTARAAADPKTQDTPTNDPAPTAGS